MSEKPKRIQRKRTKGFKLPENTVCVSRPSKFGNPYKVQDFALESAKDLNDMQLGDNDNWLGYTRALAVEKYRNYLNDNPKLLEAVKTELKGKNLACWCGLDEPCHADILLEIANA